MKVDASKMHDQYTEAMESRLDKLIDLFGKNSTAPTAQTMPPQEVQMDLEQAEDKGFNMMFNSFEDDNNSQNVTTDAMNDLSIDSSTINHE